MNRYDFEAIELKPYKGYGIDKAYWVNSDGERIRKYPPFYLVYEDGEYVGEAYETLADAKAFIDSISNSYIKSDRQPTKWKEPQASELVNRVGKHLYEHIDGAYKFSKGPNHFYVYMTVLYELPVYVGKNQVRKYSEEGMQEIDVILDITTYQNKIRVNTILKNPDEVTVGFDLFKPNQFEDLHGGCEKIEQKVRKRIDKYFEDYETLY